MSQPTPTQDVTADTVTSATEVTAAGQGEGQGQPAPAETAEPSEEQRWIFACLNLSLIDQDEHINYVTTYTTVINNTVQCIF